MYFNIPENNHSNFDYLKDLFVVKSSKIRHIFRKSTILNIIEIENIADQSWYPNSVFRL